MLRLLLKGPLRMSESLQLESPHQVVCNLNKTMCTIIIVIKTKMSLDFDSYDPASLPDIHIEPSIPSTAYDGYEQPTPAAKSY